MDLNNGPGFEVSSDIERVRSQSGEAMKGGVSECSFTYGKPSIGDIFNQIISSRLTKMLL
jgi:hypothetical protein